ncbi:flagellar export chaperone FliS [Paenibacillus ehimensis]|uniref:Flagellar secretion chaperone FliS n=1 Tax=Paenibacillus ehimensis TaxID=79264 RepID=A0ABT8VCU7_9BACL|nr:flagellar export chaperone FliS [Paenibacillus ehimensis]MDO3678814.1 flagellar export chaperone FliS [Paenibacillus ehimensis]MEC0209439.1 flagellar export chaperone FliS [Paenibacillus ehimensis]
MIQQQGQETYLRMQVTTAAPWELTLMLYNGCIKFMKQALDGIQKSDYEAKNMNIKKAIRIIDELIATLDKKYEISKNLDALYVFMKDKLFEANVKLNVEALQVSIELMTDLRDTWVKAMKSLKSPAKVQS